MSLDKIAADGLILIGAGRMGGAMLDGWLRDGLPAASVWVVDPHPPERLGTLGLHLNEPLPESPAVVVIAVKPQLLDSAIATLQPLAGGPALFVSVVAGVRMARFEALGHGTPVVRAMPNTPAAIGQGISALIANAAAGEAGLAEAEALLTSVGDTVRLEHEDQIDAVTAVSGSGPAYAFHLIEALAEAGEAEGLAPDLALRLARATVAGAGALAVQSGEAPAALREAVTSPGGTTLAGLTVLMDRDTGLPPLIRKTVAAAAARSRELGQ